MAGGSTRSLDGVTDPTIHAVFTAESESKRARGLWPPTVPRGDRTVWYSPHVGF